MTKVLLNNSVSYDHLTERFYLQTVKGFLRYIFCGRSSFDCRDRVHSIAAIDCTDDYNCSYKSFKIEPTGGH